MSQFRYSDDEYAINRILKLNQDISKTISKNHELFEQRNKADSNIESTKELLIKLGKKKDIKKLSIEVDNKKDNRRLNHRPIIQDWESLLAEANISGLVNTRDMFARAVKGGYAIPAFNFNNMEQLQAIIKAAATQKSPVILQVSKGAREYANPTLLRYMAQGAVAYAKELGCEHPEISLHLDHGDSFETCKSCVDSGFSSVMIDASALPFEENIALTKKVVEYAHAHDVTVEAELGVLAGVEDEVAHEESHYTKPEEVIEFVERTGCDSLAISVGTSHGAYKFKPEQCTRDPKTGRLVPPPLAFDVLAAIEEKLPGFPIVLHGSSSVPQEEVDTINKYGGKLPDAVGIPEEQLRKAAASAVCKINIDSDSRLAMTAAVRKVFAEKPGEFDPRKYLGPARDNMQKLYEHKIVNVLGSNNKLAQC